MQPKTVIVLGMHRSGTSMTAGILKILGVNMGKNLAGKKASNPLGHFEDRQFQKLNDRILKAAGGDSFHPPGKNAIMLQKDRFDLEIRSVLNKSLTTWGWKDPRTSLTAELYLPYLSNPYFIVCYRDAHTVAESVHQRDGLAIEEVIELKSYYDRQIEEFFTGHPGLKRLNLEYGNAVADPDAFVSNLIDFLDLQAPKKSINKSVQFILPKPSLEKLSKKLKFHDAFNAFLKKMEKKFLRGRRG